MTASHDKKKMAESHDEHRETAGDNEEGLIRHYFFRGFEYEEIRVLLMKHHDIEMSLSTLKRRIKANNLRRHLPDMT